MKHEIIKDLNYVEKGKVIDLKEGRRVFRFEFDLEASYKRKYILNLHFSISKMFLGEKRSY